MDGFNCVNLCGRTIKTSQRLQFLVIIFYNLYGICLLLLKVFIITYGLLIVIILY